MSYCNECGKDPCKKHCEPASYKCGFGIMPDPYDPSYWNVNLNGALTRVKIPKMNETDTKLSTNYSGASLIYNAEKHTDIITGAQLGGIINLDELRDVDATNPDSCDILVFDPGCSDCGDGCKPTPAMWRKYHIPDAEDCEIEPDDDGYYHVLIKDDCGCIRECRLPVAPNGSTTINYIRDSVPDDPDYPWYYGKYNDTINLYLAQNAPQFFNKYDLEVTVHYGIQVIKSDASPNTNFRSLLVPFIPGTDINVSMFSSILQGPSVAAANPQIPWGTMCLRGSFTFLVPKGKEASLHHEFRLRTTASFPNYASSPYDGQRVPDDIASQVNKLAYTASRLNALQVIVKPARGTANLTPVVDAERNQLDAAVDEYPTL